MNISAEQLAQDTILAWQSYWGVFPCLPSPLTSGCPVAGCGSKKRALTASVLCTYLQLVEGTVVLPTHLSGYLHSLYPNNR